MNIKTALQHFLDFRREIIINRSRFELKQAEQRAHILEGFKVAQENIDEVITLETNESSRDKNIVNNEEHPWMIKWREKLIEEFRKS